MDEENKNENEEEKKDEKQIEYVIEVQPDEMEATITLMPIFDNPDVSISDIKDAISQKGITYGINEDVCISIVEEKKFYEKIVIASGKKPENGKDGEIKYLVTTEEKIKVKKDDMIAEIIFPEEGVDGISVFEKEVPAENGSEVSIPTLKNAVRSSKDENKIVANINGYLFVFEGVIEVTPFFTLEVSKDKYEAFVTVVEPAQETDFDKDDVRQFLKENKIVEGIKEEKIGLIFSEKKFTEKILISKGTQVIDGKDAHIKYFFDCEIKPKVDEKGNVDFWDINLIHNVKKEQKLAEVIPVVEGKEGITVYGDKIAPKEGKPQAPPLGKNTQQSPDNSNVIISDIDGHVKLKGKLVEVEPLFIVGKDVDFSTGNIDFLGSILIKGDIKSGFKVKAQNDVEVQGIVEDAEIDSGGDVLLKTGFVGKGDGKITAKGKIMAKFCDNQSLSSNDDIIVGEYLMHSNVETKGKVIVTDQTGLIVGGEIYALKGIEAKVIGNQNYVPTKLFVGINIEIKEKIQDCKDQLSMNIENKEEIEKATMLLMKRKLLNKELPPDKKELLDELNNVKGKLDKEEKEIQYEIEKLNEKLVQFKDSVVMIYDVVYPGVSVMIYNKQLEVNEGLKEIVYKYTEKEILGVDISDYNK